MVFNREEFNSVLRDVEIKKVDSRAAAARILPLIDLTSLEENDTVSRITELCRQAGTVSQHVASVCVFPQFVSFAKSQLAGKPIKVVATVANFPKGEGSIESVVLKIQEAIVNGADEIDVVWPYKSYLSGASDAELMKFLNACREACGIVVRLKIILETGAFPFPEKIYHASNLAIKANADFIKTSTGKVNIGATSEAACAMLLAIKQCDKPVGFKASGGIRTVEEASKYLAIADHIMGSDWVSPDRFRFGASSLLHDVLDTIE